MAIFPLKLTEAMSDTSFSGVKYIARALLAGMRHIIQMLSLQQVYRQGRSTVGQERPMNQRFIAFVVMDQAGRQNEPQAYNAIQAVIRRVWWERLLYEPRRKRESRQFDTVGTC